jgi:hypothetical protein
MDVQSHRKVLEATINQCLKDFINIDGVIFDSFLWLRRQSV